MKLIHLCGDTYMIPGPSNIGVIVSGGSCIIVDSGIDDQAAKQILHCVAQAKFILKGIINTHSHADHCGGNKRLQEHKSLITYSSRIEKAIIENPFLEPFYLFSAAPPEALTTKHLMAQPSVVDRIIEPGRQVIEGITLEILALPGHSPGQIGVAVVESGVCFTADAFFGEKVLQKYSLPYFSDISSTLTTLKSMDAEGYRVYVPSHGEVVFSASSVIAKNIAVIGAMLASILAALQKCELTREEVLAGLLITSGHTLSMAQFVLNCSTVSACLTHLHNESKVTYSLREGKLLWKATTATS
ncbi:MAG: MBL fold metallo-hydrolase [bacterium]|nr:MBL fold metallo-hydrolase [bacterium]